MLTENEIKNLTDEGAFARGEKLCRTASVSGFAEKEIGRGLELTAYVLGGRGQLCDVRLILTHELDWVLEASCDCSAFEKTCEGLCEHCVAVLLFWLRRNQAERRDPDLEELMRKIGVVKGMPITKEPPHRLKSSPALEAVLRPFWVEENEAALGVLPGTVKLEPHIQKSIYGENLSLSFRIGTTQMYVLKGISDFLERVRQGREHSYGKKLGFVHREEAFTEKSRGLLHFMRKYKGIAAENGYYRGYYGGYYGRDNEMNVEKSCVDELMEILGGTSFFANLTGLGEEELILRDGCPEFHAELRKKADGAVFSLTAPSFFAGEEYAYFAENGVLWRVKNADFGRARDFFEMLLSSKKPECSISAEDLPLIANEILPDFEAVVPVSVGRLELDTLKPLTPVFTFFLDMPQRDMIVGKCYAVYGEQQYPLFEQTDRSAFLTDRRSIGEERRMREQAASYFDALDGVRGELAVNGEQSCYEFLTGKLDHLRELGEVFVSDRMKAMRIQPLSGIQVGISLSGGMLNLTLSSELPMEQLAELLSKYDRKKKYYRLKNGEFVQYDAESLNAVGELVRNLQLSEKALKKGSVEAPRYRAMFLDEELKNSHGITVESAPSYLELIRNMSTAGEGEFAVPSSLEGILRGYQKKGFLWLKNLERNGFGGILADDMGLGKTLQVITFLLSAFEAGERQRSLIVAPASLVYNWESEIRRFAPALTVRVLAGTAQERRRLLDAPAEGEILVTSYDLLKRDLELYEEQEFFCEIIDEAQYIKNAGTKGARAVKAVRARMRLALTGTPVENRLSELWSIFDYLMPGFLYSYEHFRKAFETPIVRDQNEETVRMLQRMIRPFILRRLKRDVLTDLPDKIEKNTLIPLQGEQKQLYEAHVQRLKLMLENGNDEHFGEIRMQVLAELTRLRQLCCDPSLLYEGYRGGSAKVELCMELVRNAVNGGHKILLFSQFTSMLEILEKRLTEEKIGFYSLTGSTQKQQRMELMEAFNRDKTPVFCISLKAGGTGLNLTGADIVIHCDPWWNVAAENQATDRAHRIGQRNVVTVYKLVAEHTIEEKVIELQMRKKELADQVLSGGELGSPTFDREELLKLFSDR